MQHRAVVVVDVPEVAVGHEGGQGRTDGVGQRRAVAAHDVRGVVLHVVSRAQEHDELERLAVVVAPITLRAGGERVGDGDHLALDEHLPGERARDAEQRVDALRRGALHQRDERSAGGGPEGRRVTRQQKALRCRWGEGLTQLLRGDIRLPFVGLDALVRVLQSMDALSRLGRERASGARIRSGCEQGETTDGEDDVTATPISDWTAHGFVLLEWGACRTVSSVSSDTDVGFTWCSGYS